MRAPERGGGTRVLPPTDDSAAAVLSRVFGGQAIDDGAETIRLELPHIVDRAAPVPVAVEVSWPVVLAKAGARLYLIADENPVPLLVRVTLLPDMVPPRLSLHVRLEASTLVRAVLECGDDTLLQTARWVWVLRAGTDADLLPADPAGPTPSRHPSAPATKGDSPCP